MNYFPWVFLQEGDSIDIIAQSSWHENQEFSPSLITSILKKMGFNTKILPNLIQRQQGGEANTIHNRQSHFLQCLKGSSKAIWSLKGGYSACSLFNNEDFLSYKGPPKLLAGYSDFTVFHLWAFKRNWPSLHCISAYFNKEIYNKSCNALESVHELVPLFKGEKRTLVYNDFIPLNEKAKIAQRINVKEIRGGNLSLIQRNIGTELELNTTKREALILFFEDIQEPPYKIEEFFYHLTRTGRIFTPAVKGVIFGDFTSETPIDNTLERISHTLLANFPCYKTSLFGHGSVNKPLFLGTPSLILNKEGDISLHNNTNQGLI